MRKLTALVIAAYAAQRPCPPQGGGHRDDPGTQWNATHGEPYFTYQSGGAAHTVWFEDGRSEALRIQMAQAAHIGGVAMWRLGGEGAGTWRSTAAYASAAPLFASLR